MAKGKMSKIDLENLLRAKLRCSCSCYLDKDYRGMYVAYIEALAMHEVLNTFFEAKHFTEYFYDFKDVEFNIYSFACCVDECEKLCSKLNKTIDRC